VCEYEEVFATRELLVREKLLSRFFDSIDLLFFIALRTFFSKRVVCSSSLSLSFLIKKKGRGRRGTKKTKKQK
jgi:hypothetical protein